MLSMRASLVAPEHLHAIVRGGVEWPVLRWGAGGREGGVDCMRDLGWRGEDDLTLGIFKRRWRCWYTTGTMGVVDERRGGGQRIELELEYAEN